MTLSKLLTLMMLMKLLTMRFLSLIGILRLGNHENKEIQLIRLVNQILRWDVEIVLTNREDRAGY